MESFDAANLKKLGWRQGSLLPESLVQQLIKEGLMEAQNNSPTLVVISQSCDLTNADIAKEPFVEVLLGSMAEANPNMFYGKNSRTLHLERGDNQALQFVIHDKLVLPRISLGSVGPGGKLPKNEISLLTKWVARRYTRAAFPDEFNRRIHKVEEKLHKSLKNAGSLIYGIWIDVVDDDLPATENYQVIVFVVAEHDAFMDPEKRAKAKEIANKVEGHLKACKGIEVVGDVLFLSSTQFSIDQYMNTKRWDFDDISLRDENQDVPTH